MSFDREQFKMRPETQTLIQAIAAVEIGRTVTYKELSAKIGKDVRPVYGVAHGLLCTARRRVQRDLNMVFVAIPTVGLQRVEDARKVSESTRQIAKSRRAGKRSIGLAIAVDDFDKLPADKQVEHNRNISIAGVLQQFTSQHGMLRIEKVVANTKATVPVLSALEAFKGS